MLRYTLRRVTSSSGSRTAVPSSGSNSNSGGFRAETLKQRAARTTEERTMLVGDQIQERQPQQRETKDTATTACSSTCSSSSSNDSGAQTVLSLDAYRSRWVGPKTRGCAGTLARDPEPGMMGDRIRREIHRQLTDAVDRAELEGRSDEVAELRRHIPEYYGDIRGDDLQLEQTAAALLASSPSYQQEMKRRREQQQQLGSSTPDGNASKPLTASSSSSSSSSSPLQFIADGYQDAQGTTQNDVRIAVNEGAQRTAIAHDDPLLAKFGNLMKDSLVTDPLLDKSGNRIQARQQEHIAGTEEQKNQTDDADGVSGAADEAMGVSPSRESGVVAKNRLTEDQSPYRVDWFQAQQVPPQRRLAYYIVRHLRYLPDEWREYYRRLYRQEMKANINPIARNTFQVFMMVADGYTKTKWVLRKFDAPTHEDTIPHPYNNFWENTTYEERSYAYRRADQMKELQAWQRYEDDVDEDWANAPALKKESSYKEYDHNPVVAMNMHINMTAGHQVSSRDLPAPLENRIKMRERENELASLMMGSAEDDRYWNPVIRAREARIHNQTYMEQLGFEEDGDDDDDDEGAKEWEEREAKNRAAMRAARSVVGGKDKHNPTLGLEGYTPPSEGGVGGVGAGSSLASPTPTATTISSATAVNNASDLIAAAAPSSSEATTTQRRVWKDDNKKEKDDDAGAFLGQEEAEDDKKEEEGRATVVAASTSSSSSPQQRKGEDDQEADLKRKKKIGGRIFSGGGKKHGD